MGKTKTKKSLEHNPEIDYEVIYKLVRGNYNQPLTVSQKELFDTLERIKFWSMQYIEDAHVIRLICSNLSLNETEAYQILAKAKKIHDILPQKSMVANSIMNELQASIKACEVVGDLREKQKYIRMKIEMFEMLEKENDFAKQPPSKIIVKLNPVVYDKKVISSKLKALIGEDVYAKFAKQTGFENLIIMEKNEARKNS